MSALDAGDVVLVTGASGTIGRVVVPCLADAGLRVVAADRAQHPSPKAELTLTGDVQDPRFVDTVLHPFGRPVDGVVHLAAIAAPGQVPEDETLALNVRGAYLILDGAGRAGAKVAVAASSVAAYGYAWADRGLSPTTVPLIEDDPVATIDSYGLSKLFTEQIGAFATRRWGLPTVLLRFPFVGDGERLAARLAEVAADAGGNRHELWAWLDTRDAARAVYLALTSGLTGHHILNAAASDTAAPFPTAELLARYHPSTVVKNPLTEFGSLVTSAAAQELLGFTAARSWRRD